ncbi:transposase [Streptomyces sp. VTCC 41912]|uniref:IS701 family transposase n=1 Tax=Streptomyces sp. VTCC 41912 TaxID=3383243 RepID=UPI003896D20B
MQQIAVPQDQHSSCPARSPPALRSYTTLHVRVKGSHEDINAGTYDARSLARHDLVLQLQFAIAAGQERLFECSELTHCHVSGFLKQRETSAGAQRQYSGTVGRAKNCQVGVFAACASSRGRTLVDREVYLPKSWTSDRERCQAAKVPVGRGFATKAELARVLVARARSSPLPFPWVTADALYGQDGHFRRMLEEAELGYVRAVAKSQQVNRTMAACGPRAGQPGRCRADQTLTCPTGAAVIRPPPDTANTNAARTVTNNRHMTVRQFTTRKKMLLNSGNSELQLEY